MVLVLLRTAFLLYAAALLRWPLHPMGYIFTGFCWIGSVTAGWFFKWLAVRYGGAQTYRSLLPYFWTCSERSLCAYFGLP